MSSQIAMTLTVEQIQNKYMKWMANLTQDQFAGMCWLVGEFVARASARDYDIENAIGGDRRKIGALKALASFNASPMGMTETRKYIRAIVSDGEVGRIKCRIRALVENDKSELAVDERQRLMRMRGELLALLGSLDDETQEG